MCLLYFLNKKREKIMISNAPINFGNVVGGSMAIPSAVNNTYFFYRASGFLVPSVTGKYTIGVNCADGCNVYVGDQAVVATLTETTTANGTALYTNSSDILLTAGVFYQITLEWQHGAGSDYEFQVLWTPPLGVVSLITAANISNTSDHISGILDADWWNGTSGLWYPGGNGTIDFSNSAHPNKTLDNIGDGVTFARVKSSALTDGIPNAGALATLTDVTLTSPANNDVLTYVTADGKWENKPSSGAGNILPALGTYFTQTNWQTGTSAKQVVAAGPILFSIADTGGVEFQLLTV